MRLYYFTTAKWGMVALSERRLKIAQIPQLNDPYEFRAVYMTHSTNVMAIERAITAFSEKCGVLCMTDNWHEVLMWSHYAERHQGLCLGFNVSDEHARKVEYIDRPTQDKSLDLNNIREDLIKSIFNRKSLAWKYESEFRFYCTLSESVGGNYFKSFGPDLKLSEIIVGCQASRLDVSSKGIRSALEGYDHGVDIFKVKMNPNEFKMVEDLSAPDW